MEVDGAKAFQEERSTVKSEVLVLLKVLIPILKAMSKDQRVEFLHFGVSLVYKEKMEWSNCRLDEIMEYLEKKSQSEESRAK